MPAALDLQSDIILDHILLFRGGKEIIRDVEGRIRPGKTTVFMGSSGCGKSTLLKIAAGLIPPDRGRVLAGERDINTLSDRESMHLRQNWGFVFQDAALWANRSIIQNLTLPLLYHNPQMGIKAAEEQAEKLARKIGYRDELTLRPSQLSSGEMKMVSFARALVNDPAVLFLDSPFLAVDHASVERMKKIILDLKHQGRTICAIFQDAKFIAQIADDLFIIKEGRLIASGTFADIINTRDREVSQEITELFDQAASYDGSILDILSGQGEIE